MGASLQRHLLDPADLFGNPVPDRRAVGAPTHYLYSGQLRQIRRGSWASSLIRGSRWSQNSSTRFARTKSVNTSQHIGLFTTATWDSSWDSASAGRAARGTQIGLLLGAEQRLLRSRHCDFRRNLRSEAQEQMKLRSPSTLSIRPTAGQNLYSRTHGRGHAAISRGYGRFHSVRVTCSAV